MDALAFRTLPYHALYTMKTELWQRLRQARRYADLTQADLAARCNVTRGAVALWEAAEPEHRTKPTTDNLIKVSKETGAPLEWLLNDAADLDALWRLGGEFGEGSRRAVAAASGEAMEDEPDVLPDLRQGGHVFVFATNAEQAARKLAQLTAEAPEVKKHLILVGPRMTDIHFADTPTDALASVVQILTEKA